MAEKLYIVIPAYNEQERIAETVKEWYPVAEKAGPESRLCVINDGSKDNTEKILLDLAKELPMLTVLTKANGGHGAAVLYGYRYALDQGADFIFQTDSDGQTLPSEFDAFWQNRSAYSAIIGSRISRQDGVSRIIVTRVLRLVVLLTFGVFVEDANTPYRLMKAEVLKKCLEYIPTDYHLGNVALSAILIKKKYAVKFLPITFRPRQGGKNSINLKRIIKIGMKSVGELRKISSQVRYN